MDQNKIKKAIPIILLALIMIGLIPEMNLQASTPGWNSKIATSFTGGNGTESGPYQISSGNELAYLAQLVNSGEVEQTSSQKYAELHYILTGNINLNYKSWTPIGIDGANQFTGAFNGNGYVISKLSISGGYTYAGLFGCADRAVVKNLGVEGLSFSLQYSTKGSCVGGVIAHTRNTKVLNCYATGSVNVQGSWLPGSTSVTGGLVGYSRGNSFIANSFARVNIDDVADHTVYVGGLIGRTDSVSITENCYQNGNVVGNNSNNPHVSSLVADKLGKLLNCSTSGQAKPLTDYAIAMMDKSLENKIYAWSVVPGKNDNQAMINGIGNTVQFKYAPKVLNPNIRGTASTGQILQGEYTYFDMDFNENESGSTYQWYRASDDKGGDAAKIDGATDRTYTITDQDVGFYLSFEVTPKNANEEGNAVKTGYTWKVISSDYWDGSIAAAFSGGNGTQNNPYQISSASELAYLSTIFNGGANSDYSGKYYRLTRDIDLGYMNQWTPIGIDPTKSFKGTFDGNGKVISNLTMGTGHSPNTTNKYAGLFGSVENAAIKNIGLENIFIHTKISNWHNIVGGLIGNSKNSIIVNCYTTGAIKATIGGSNYSAAGGLIGYAVEQSFIANSYSSAAVFGSGPTAYSGGLAGIIQSNSSVSNCYATGTVASDSRNPHVGGLVGSDYGSSSSISNSYWNRSVNRNVIKGVGSGAADAMPKTAEEMKNRSFAAKLNSSAGRLMSNDGSLQLSFWSILLDKNQCLPVINGVGNAERTVSLIALDITISGAGIVAHMGLSGDVLTGSYTYYHPKGDMEDPQAVQYQWYRSNEKSGIGAVKINGATAVDYTTTDEDKGRFITLEIIPVSQNNEVGVTQTSSYVKVLSIEDGKGTNADPFLIENRAQLEDLAEFTNTGVQDENGNAYAAGHYKLTGNIDLAGREWTPVGVELSNSFRGAFDGNGYVISNLFLGADQSPNTTHLFAGFFGSIRDAVIKDLGIESLYINTNVSNADSNTGGLAGHANNTKIINCYTTGAIVSSVNGGNHFGAVGGLAGNETVKSEIVNSYSLVEVAASAPSAYAGGLTGIIRSGAMVTNCYAAGKVSVGSSKRPRSGGLVGENSGMISCGYWNRSDNPAGANDSAGNPDGFPGALGKTVLEMKDESFAAILTGKAQTLMDASTGLKLGLWSVVPSKNESYPMINGVGNNEVYTKPFANSVTAIGFTQSGKVLKGFYKYNDLGGHPEDKHNSVYQWSRASDTTGADIRIIPGATEISYKLTDADIGYHILFEVMPTSDNGETGVGVKSEYTQKITGKADYTALSKKTAGDVIQFGGREWILLDPEKGMMILSSRADRRPWNENYYDGNKYPDSDIRAYLNGVFLNSLPGEVITDTTWSYTGGTLVDKVGLLSRNEYNAYKNTILNSDDWDYGWWLIDVHGHWKYSGLIVKKDGSAYWDREVQVSDSHGVRPVIYLEPGLVVGKDNIVDIRPFYAPVGTGNTPTNDTTPTFTWESRSIRGCGMYRYKLADGNLETGAADNFEILPFKITAPEYTAPQLPEGIHRLYVQEAGLDWSVHPIYLTLDATWSQLGRIEITIDTTSPVLTTELTDEETYDGSKTFSVTATDNIDSQPTITVKQGNEIITPNGSGDYSVDLSVGSNTIIITAKDDAGNTAIVNKTIRRRPDSASFAGGKGTENDPYKIADAGQLMYFAELVNHHNTTCAGLHYELSEDIDLGEKEWIPVGLAAGNSFKGTLNGNGKAVKNLKIGIEQSPVSLLNVGIFGYTNGALIKNVGVENLAVHVDCTTSHLSAGGLVGYLKNTKIMNCHATGKIDALTSKFGHYSVIGGLIGFAQGGNRIFNSYAIVEVAGSGQTNYAGGFAGIAYESSTVANCYSYGIVTSSSPIRYIGGFVGSVDPQGNHKNNISNGYWIGSINTGLSGAGFGSSNTIDMTAEKMKTPSFAVTLTNNALDLINTDNTLELREWRSVPGSNKDLPLHGTDNASTNHAPDKANVTIPDGSATPESSDKSVAAVPYIADVTPWFDDQDGDNLTYEVVSASQGSDDVKDDITISGSVLTYTPQSAQANQKVTMEIKANDGTKDSLNNVVVSVTVGPLPANANHAPDKVNIPIPDGSATPASRDKSVAAVPYIADVTPWFEDRDNDSLTYEVISASQGSNDVRADISIIGSALTYIPKSAQANQKVTIKIKANDGTEDSLNNVVVSVTVGVVPANITVWPVNVVIPKIKGNGTVIKNGDTTPSIRSNTNFGIVEISKERCAKTFVIKNYGNASLVLYGSPAIKITGPGASDFSIAVLPNSVVSPGAQSEFRILFDPETAGRKTAVITLSGNFKENTYSFTVNGRGSLLGDLDGDQKVDMKDVILSLQVLSGKNTSGIKNPDTVKLPGVVHGIQSISGE